MTEFSTLARPYAEALFEMAKAEGRETEWSRALGQLAAWVSNAAAQEFLDDPERPERDRIALLSGIGVDVDSAEWERLVCLLIRNGRWKVAAQIAQLYDEAMWADRRLVDVLVTSAIALSGQQKGEIQAALERRHPGCHMVLREAVDPALVAGFVIQAGDQTVDASVRGQLMQLAQHLRN